MPASTPPSPGPQRRPDPAGLRSRAFKLLILATAASFSGYVLLLPTVPLWAARGGAGEFGAGSTTAAFMLATVLTQLAMPWLLNRGGYRWTFPAGALFLALPTPLLLLSSDLAPVIVISAVRGIGFGMVTVVGAAQSVRLVPARHLGRAASYYGAAVGIPILAFLSLGVWLALNVGFAIVFWIATALPLVGAAAAVALWYAGGASMQKEDKGSAESADGAGSGTSGSPAARRAPSTARIWLALIAPLVLMLALALASSAIVTFLAIPLSDAAAVATAALLGYGAFTVFGRWLAGHLSDRYNRAVVILPSTVAAAAAMALLTWALWPAGTGWDPTPLETILIVAGATLFGGAFGAVQNDTIVAMFRRAGPQGYGTASAVWNIGYDAGTGAGALSLGLVAQTLGFGPTYAITAIVIAACIPAAFRLSRSPNAPVPG